MEYFGSRDEGAHSVSLAEVANCNLYVGVLAGRFGTGITEDEYRAAREAQLPCFFYLKQESEIAEADRDAAPDRLGRLKAFREEVTDPRSGHLAQTFSGPDDLAAQVAADLHSWVFDRILAQRVQVAAQAGEFGLLRQIVQLTKDEGALRTALQSRGVSLAPELFDSLLTLAGPAVLERLLRGVEKLGTDYGIRIQNFLHSYLGTSDHPVAFGGRDSELATIDGWLDSADAERYLLLSGDAGSGKSALLVHWSRRLLDHEGITVIFVPVSIRFRTSLAAVFLPVLAARLAEFYGERITPRSDVSVEVWRGTVSNYLAREVPSGQRLVVVLDGVDEAADWTPGLTCSLSNRQLDCGSSCRPDTPQPPQTAARGCAALGGTVLVEQRRWSWAR
jgi:AAA ATPase-like protein